MRQVHSDWKEQRIRIPGRTVFLPYYTTSPWGKDEEFFVFFSALPDFSRVWLGCYSPGEGKVIREQELVNWRDRPLAMVSEELLSSVFLPEQRALLLPRGPELYRVSIDDGSETLVYRHADGAMRLGGPGGRSPDGALAVFGAFAPAQGPADRVEMLVLDAESGKLLANIGFNGFWADHFQFMKDPGWIAFAHEGATEGIDDRVNRVNWKTGEKQLLHRHETGSDGSLLECIGHEMTGGDVVCAVRYPVSVLPGALLVMNLDGGDCRALDCDDYWHASCNPSGTVFAMDTMWWGNTKRREVNAMDIIRIDRAAGTKEIVKSIRSNPKFQFRHPHPQPNAAGDRLLFIEDADAMGELGSITLCSL